MAATQTLEEPMTRPPDRAIPPELTDHIDALPDAQWLEFLSLIGHWLLRAELDPFRQPEKRPDVRGLGQRHVHEENE